MKLSEIIQSNDDVVDYQNNYLDAMRYKDHFNNKDEAFDVILYNKIWKSFPTKIAAEFAANSYNKKHNKIMATVRAN